ncbi:FtsW/RodA/SpoVE family cell cycle protein [Simkania negevensis]|uniref:FtsW/RodA/SpoVE family cell cycle protein n=1 Tax=Simkania negevensis TaxID=83561 RepID=A0ABS3AWV3_9BACT|nr:FtsW/RodA/SpoVE family cell cycle protein [Simkania negevensis]
MWNPWYLKRIDLRVLPVILSLMVISLLVISSYTTENYDGSEESFFTAQVINQLKWFALGWCVYLFFAGFDYNKLREWAWILYLLIVLALIGLYFTPTIRGVHRWYKMPLLNFYVQPSEIAKLGVVFALSWFLERKVGASRQWKTTLLSGLIVGIPFILILFQPDLDTALVLYPVTLGIFYFGDVHPFLVRAMAIAGVIGLVVTMLLLLDVLPHDDLRPYATLFLKDYQYERFNPQTHHQSAALTSISVGGLTGQGWRMSTYAGRGWLPATHTDSVFSAFGEEFGFLGLLLLIILFYTLISFGFQVTAIAKDYFGRLLSAGITVYLAVHVLINMGMMLGFLPVTGVPLILVTYGGSSLLATMAALGILQSIYSRRFMF